MSPSQTSLLAPPTPGRSTGSSITSLPALIDVLSLHSDGPRLGAFLYPSIRELLNPFMQEEHMAILKRLQAQVGSSAQGGSKVAREGTICPHCRRQSTLVPSGDRYVCNLCRKAPGDL